MASEISIKRFHADVEAGRLDEAEAILKELVEPINPDEQSQPFHAPVRIKPQYLDPERTLDDLGLESSAALPLANGLSRKLRNARYMLKIALRPDAVRIVTEGDSWFQYPVLLDDIVDELARDDDKAIYSLGAAGDTLANIVRQKEYLDALAQTGAKLLLLSAAGNDFLGDGAFEALLKSYSADTQPQELINWIEVDAAVARVISSYRKIVEEVAEQYGDVQIITHGYDVSYPMQDGRWLGAPLGRKGIPLDLGRDIVGLVLDKLHDGFRKLSDEVETFTFVNLRGVVDRGHRSWFDELHPRDAGYARAADTFRQTIAEFHSAGQTNGLEALSADPSIDGLEAQSAEIVIDPGHGGSPPPTKVGGSSWNNAIGPNGTLEKTLTLDVCKRAAEILRARGHHVSLTRDTDVNLGLKARAGVAKVQNAAVFVSIHFNGSKYHNAQGTETFVSTNHISASAELCRSVQAAMVAALGHRDRNLGHPDGVKRANFGVLRRSHHAAKTACILHEVSFLDRAAEEQRLQSDQYRDKIARALAAGIEAYLGGGLEFAASEPDDGSLGDAIELEAAENSLSVPAFLGLAERVPHKDPNFDAGYPHPRHFRGHELASLVELPSPDFSSENRHPIDRILAEISRRRDGFSASANTDDVKEFSQVPFGEPLCFDDLGYQADEDRRTLEREFEALESSGSYYDDFARYIESLGLRYFSPAEFLYLGGSNSSGHCAGLNTLPPRALWSNLRNSALMLDEIRHRLGAPVHILSCYRSPAYNTCIDGASGSLHLKFNAIDWRCRTGNVADWVRVADEVRGSDPDYSGGIGRYSNFVHIDTRGHDTNW